MRSMFSYKLHPFDSLANRNSVLFCHRVAYLVYTTAYRVDFAILLSYINDICELAMKFTFSAQEFFRKQSRIVSRKLTLPRQDILNLLHGFS